MEPRGDRPFTPADVRNGTGRPVLPGFSAFVSGAGQGSLALRQDGSSEMSRLEKEDSPRYASHSLPTPPATTHSGWREEQRTATYFEHGSPHPFTDSATRTTEVLRRSSIMLPMQAVPEPKQVRSYSSTTTRPDIHLPMAWTNGPISQELNVAGKSMCYVYDDGQNWVRGNRLESVNPKWGTTKAGKPRKRLGQACNTCREKKIKCDPNYPKCSQCHKFNRECKFEAQARTTQNKSPKARASTTSPRSCDIPEEAIDVLRRSSVAPTEVSTPLEQPQHQLLSKTSLAPDELLSPTSTARPDTRDARTPSKRQRMASSYEERELDLHDVEMKDIAANPTKPVFSVDHDPILVDEKVVLHYLSAFIRSLNVATFEIFPQGHIFPWARSEEQKTIEDRMVLYAVLALSACFISDSAAQSHRVEFTTAARQGLLRSPSLVSVQTVQAGMFLSLAEYAQGDFSAGFITFGRAAREAARLKMYVESATDSRDSCRYGLSKSMYEECKRRTFWAVYCIELYSNACGGGPTTFDKADIFLRLPCAPHRYEQDDVPDTIMCDEVNCIPQGLSDADIRKLSPMASFIQLATICSDVETAIKRAALKFKFGRVVSNEATMKSFEARLDQWENNYYRINNLNEQSSSPARERSVGSELVCNFARMQVHRHRNHSKLSDKEVASHAHRAREYAIQTLTIAQRLLEPGGQQMRDNIFATISPLAGFALFTAIDIITAAGTIKDVLQDGSQTIRLVYRGVELLDQLAETWQIARLQHTVCEHRSRVIFGTASQLMMERKVAFYCSNSMLPDSTPEIDIIYGTNRRKYLGIFRWDEAMQKDSDMQKIETTAMNMSVAR